MSEICLKVKNIQSLDSHSMHHHIFNHLGGSIGMGNDNAWIINDKNKTIQNIQALINFEEGIFGIKPYDKHCKIFLNDSFSALSSSYETQIQIGDCLRMGDLEIEVMTPQAFAQEATKTQTLSDLGDLKPYDKFDHLDIQPKGVEQDSNLLIEENLDLLEEHNDVLELNQPKNIPQSHLIMENDYFASYKNIQTMISQRAKALQDQFSFTQSLQLNQNKFKMFDLESRINHFLLLENKEILNLLILSVLCKALYNPNLQNLYPDFFEKSISEILEECINGNGELLQKILLSTLCREDKRDH